MATTARRTARKTTTTRTAKAAAKRTKRGVGAKGKTAARTAQKSRAASAKRATSTRARRSARGGASEARRSLPPFVNEALTDFQQPRNQRAFRDALAHVQEELGRHYPNVIAGERFDLPERIVSTNPAKPDEVIGTFPSSGAVQADRAVEAADAAFPAWAATPWERRADIAHRVARGLRNARHRFSAWMVKEEGKSWVEADADTAEAIDFCEYYAREALRYARGVPVVQTEDHNECFYVPLGVGAVIAPWNFPLAILCGMTVAALVTGNTVVMKPAEESPTIAWHLFELLEEVGVPAGAVAFLTGPGETVGARLVQHPRVRFVSFTGSKDVGLWITEQAGRRMPGQPWIKRVVAEMGGKDAIIVDADCDVDEAARGVAASAFGFQGQKCSACSRAIVLDDVYEPFVDRLVAATRETFRMGDPTDVANNFGPLISKEAHEKTRGYLDVARGEGEIVAGGRAGEGAGWFVEPTIVRDVPPDARIAQEEIFGPVLSVIRARDWDHALEIANGTEYGLTGGVYSRDPEHLEDARRRFHVGNLYLNRKCTGALVGAQPFGGFGMSGTCSKAGGPDYLGLFLQQKAVATRERSRRRKS
jgi:1-pyrroline-5-carboxylate dehydrogenase